MNYYRYMSFSELVRLLNGETLTNYRVHRFTGLRTTSVGFCFLGSPVEARKRDGSLRTFQPEQAYHFLSGIVSGDALVRFEADMDLTQAIGIYADPEGESSLSEMLRAAARGSVIDDIPVLIVVEYCCTEYSRETMRPTDIYLPHTNGMYFGGSWHTIKEYERELKKTREKRRKRK